MKLPNGGSAIEAPIVADGSYILGLETVDGVLLQVMEHVTAIHGELPSVIDYLGYKAFAYHRSRKVLSVSSGAREPDHYYVEVKKVSLPYTSVPDPFFPPDTPAEERTAALLKMRGAIGQPQGGN